MSSLKFKPSDRQSIDFAEEERLRFEAGGGKDRAVIDASNLSEENVASWRSLVGSGKVLCQEYIYNEGLVFSGHGNLYTTTINSPTDTVLVFFAYCDSIDTRTSWVRMQLGDQTSPNLVQHNSVSNNTWKSCVHVFNNVPKNTNLTLSIDLKSQNDMVTITIPAYNLPECLVVSI